MEGLELADDDNGDSDDRCDDPEHCEHIIKRIEEHRQQRQEEVCFTFNHMPTESRNVLKSRHVHVIKKQTYFQLAGDPPYIKNIKEMSDAAIMDPDSIPDMNVKEAAEVLAHAAVQNFDKPSTSSTDIIEEDVQWTLAAYMEGIAEFQEEMDAKVRQSLDKAFSTIKQGLDEIEEGHKLALSGIAKQRQGLIKLHKVCENTPLYKVARVVEEVMGVFVSEDTHDVDKDTSNIPKQEAKKIVEKVSIPEPSCIPVRFFTKNKQGKQSRHYRCPKCNYFKVNREAVNAHIREEHDNTKIGPCDGCGIYFSHNKESFLTHVSSCSKN